MTQMLSLNIYRTKNITINKEQYIIRFAVNSDNSDYAMFVSNDSNGKQNKYHFGKDVAEAFDKKTGKELENSIMEYMNK